MKIGMTCYPTVGGSGIVATRLGIQLANRGHQVHFITYEQPFELQLPHPGIQFHGIKISNYELFKYPDYALALAVGLAQVAREYQLDLFHAHYAIPHATSAWIARELLAGKGPKIVTTLHGTDISLIGRDRSFFELVRYSMEASDGITAVSNYLSQETLGTFHLNRVIEVIPNFVLDPSKKGDRPPCFPKEKKILIHVSNFRPVKRISDVIEVFARVRSQVDSLLVLVGEGSGLESAEALARQLGVNEDILLLGTRHDVENLLSHSDLFLLPSEQESFGLAALEAMSCGVPVIASRAGGLPELIEEGEQGYLLPIGDVEGMAKMGIRLLQDVNLHRKLSESAHKRAHCRFGVDRVVSQYEEYYYRILT